MAGGRPRKDPALKALAGTQRPDRDVGSGEIAVRGPMIVPLHLSDLAQLQFGSIARMLEEQGRSSPHFAEVVALLAQRLEQIQRWQAVLEVEGDTYETIGPSGRMFRSRPEVKLLADAMRHAQSLLGDLMLNPASALRLASGDRAPEAGEFDDF